MPGASYMLWNFVPLELDILGKHVGRSNCYIALVALFLDISSFDAELDRHHCPFPLFFPPKHRHTQVRRLLYVQIMQNWNFMDHDAEWECLVFCSVLGTIVICGKYRICLLFSYRSGASLKCCKFGTVPIVSRRYSW